MISVFLDGRQESKDEKRTREGEEKKGKAKERAGLSFSFSFLRVHACLPPWRDERFSLLFFFFSLNHCETLRLRLPLESFLAAPVP